MSSIALRHAATAALAASLVLGTGQAVAQGFAISNSVDPAIVACLTPSRDDRPQVKYPDGAQASIKEARVYVQLEFTGPDAPPRTTTTYSFGGPEFESIVHQYVSVYRLPCLSPSAAPVTLRQEFVFTPDDSRPVAWRPPQAVAARDSAKCVGKHVLDARDIAYPAGARRRQEEGTLIAHLVFADRGAAPVVAVLNEDAAPTLAAMLKQKLGGVRLECAGEDVRWPKVAIQTFKFRWDGGYALKDLRLETFLRSVKDVRKEGVRFDTTAMSCPFDVEFTLYQPHLKNTIRELGPPDPARSEFLYWLGGLSLDLPPSTAKHVLGDTIKLSVPCLVLDLSS
ncbi:MAG TPA: hypothetical protein VGE16_00265 [Albitalea sp.]